MLIGSQVSHMSPCCIFGSLTQFDLGMLQSEQRLLMQAEECIWSGNLSSGCTRMSVPDPCPVVFECMQQEASNIVQSDGVVLPDWLP